MKEIFGGRVIYDLKVKSDRTTWTDGFKDGYHTSLNECSLPLEAKSV